MCAFQRGSEQKGYRWETPSERTEIPIKMPMWQLARSLLNRPKAVCKPGHAARVGSQRALTRLTKHVRSAGSYFALAIDQALLSEHLTNITEEHMFIDVRGLLGGCAS